MPCQERVAAIMKAYLASVGPARKSLTHFFAHLK